jgi:hypothetical protein
MKHLICFLSLVWAFFTSLNASDINSNYTSAPRTLQGDTFGEAGFKIPAFAGDILEVERVPRIYSDLDGDPFDDDNYIEGEYLNEDAFETGEGGIFERLKDRRAAKKLKKAEKVANKAGLVVRPSAKSANLPAKDVNAAIDQQINTLSVMNSAPGTKLNTNMILPFLSQNGAVDAPPTAVAMDGQNFFQTLTRYQTTYPALSSQKTTTSTGATMTFTWADSDFTGGVGATPVIILSHAASQINAAAGAKYSVGVSAYDETGKALVISTWAYRRKLANDRVLVYLIPYLEVASKLYPVIIKVVATKSCVITLDGVPVDEAVTSIMPGTNHADFLAFKELLQVK